MACRLFSGGRPCILFVFVDVVSTAKSQALQVGVHGQVRCGLIHSLHR